MIWEAGVKWFNSLVVSLVNADINTMTMYLMLIEKKRIQFHDN